VANPQSLKVHLNSPSDFSTGMGAGLGTIGFTVVCIRFTVNICAFGSAMLAMAFVVSSKVPIVDEMIVSNEFQADEEPGEETRALFLLFLFEYLFAVFCGTFRFLDLLLCLSLWCSVR
jgi:hypothetical protein